MKRICFIIPYFGKWPIWFPAFLASCKTNPTIDWLFFTDCEVPDPKPDNVHFHPSSLAEVRDLVNVKIGMEVNLQSPRKLCDLKPTYGHVFEDYLKNYDFWGFCDIDVIWGDLRSFITDDMLKEYDLISSRKNNISGHFTILKNNSFNRRLYRDNNLYQELFKLPEFKWFDENSFTKIVKDKKREGALKVYWDRYLVNIEGEIDSHQEYHLDKWLFKSGKLFDLGKSRMERNEHMYLHFINWKRTMKTCELTYSDMPESFYISYKTINKSPHSKTAHFLNILKNKFNGYHARLERKRRMNKAKKVSYGIRRKLNLCSVRSAQS